MASVNEALSKIGKDTLSGLALLQEVLNHKDTPLDVKVQCAGLLIRHETAPDTEHRYVAYFPVGCSTLEEWRERHAKGEETRDPDKEARWGGEIPTVAEKDDEDKNAK